MSMFVTDRFSVPFGFNIVLLFLHSLIIWDCRIQHLFGNRVALNPGLGGVRDVTSAISCQEQTQYNRVFYFRTLDAVFQMISSDY